MPRSSDLRDECGCGTNFSNLSNENYFDLDSQAHTQCSLRSSPAIHEKITRDILLNSALGLGWSFYLSKGHSFKIFNQWAINLTPIRIASDMRLGLPLNGKDGHSTTKSALFG